MLRSVGRMAGIKKPALRGLSFSALGYWPTTGEYLLFSWSAFWLATVLPLAFSGAHVSPTTVKTELNNELIKNVAFNLTPIQVQTHFPFIAVVVTAAVAEDCNRRACSSHRHT